MQTRRGRSAGRRRLQSAGRLAQRLAQRPAPHRGPGLPSYVHADIQTRPDAHTRTRTQALTFLFLSRAKDELLLPPMPSPPFLSPPLFFPPLPFYPLPSHLLLSLPLRSPLLPFTSLHFSSLSSLSLGSRVVSVLDSGAEGPGFRSQPRRCRVTVLGKLLTPIVPLFTKQRNWYRLTGREGNRGPGGK